MGVSVSIRQVVNNFKELPNQFSIQESEEQVIPEFNQQLKYFLEDENSKRNSIFRNAHGMLKLDSVNLFGLLELVDVKLAGLIDASEDTYNKYHFMVGDSVFNQNHKNQNNISGYENLSSIMIDDSKVSDFTRTFSNYDVNNLDSNNKTDDKVFKYLINGISKIKSVGKPIKLSKLGYKNTSEKRHGRDSFFIEGKEVKFYNSYANTSMQLVTFESGLLALQLTTYPYAGSSNEYSRKKLITYHVITAQINKYYSDKKKSDNNLRYRCDSITLSKTIFNTKAKSEDELVRYLNTNLIQKYQRVKIVTDDRHFHVSDFEDNFTQGNPNEL